MNEVQVHMYANPWHRPGRPEYGPAKYSTPTQPTTHLGYNIYERVRGSVWDVVKDGICVTQAAGPNGARRLIEEHLEAKGKEAGA